MKNRKIKMMIWISPKTLLSFVTCIALGISLFYVCSARFSIGETWTQWAVPLSGKTILVDPGHGGEDGGAVSRDGIAEKMINLNISMFLRDYLQQSGALVKLTREIDRDLASSETKKLNRRKTEDLQRRTEMILDNNIDMFISVHLNSFRSSRYHGAQTFYTENHRDNEKLAVCIQDTLIKNLENTNRVAKIIDSPIYLLNKSKIPSVLIEAGFLSNPEEAALLASIKYQKIIANSIYQGILNFYVDQN